MKPETFLELLRITLRFIEIFYGRRPPRERAAPRAEPASEAAASPVAAEAEPRRQSGSGALVGSMVVGAVAAGAVAYLVVRQQRRVQERYRLLASPFPYELLDILAAPGGGERLTATEAGLVDAATDAVYPLVDGIPDFSPASGARDEKPQANQWGSLTELVTPLAPTMLGANRAGNTTFAVRAAAAAGSGWVLSVPCGMGDVEIDMARANPQARILCLHTQWNTLLEVRRRARAEQVDNLYFARGTAILLPVRSAAADAIWSADGFHRYTLPEMAMTQMARVLRPGGVLAGVSLVKGGSEYYEQLMERSGQRLPGRRDEQKHVNLLKASGFGALTAYRDGAYLRIMGVLD